MQVSPKLSLAAVAAVVAATPVGIALAADSSRSAPARPVPIAAPLAGHPSVDGQMHQVGSSLRRRARRHTAGRVNVPPLLKRIAECESHGSGVEILQGAHVVPVEDELAERRFPAGCGWIEPGVGIARRGRVGVAVERRVRIPLVSRPSWMLSAAIVLALVFPYTESIGPAPAASFRVCRSARILRE